MLAFGRDGVLKRDEIENVVAYVRSPVRARSRTSRCRQTSKPGRRSSPPTARPVMATTAKGNPDVGAPNLTDRDWIYGSDAESIYNTVWDGRQGHMPTWESRLSPVERKILALYLLDLQEAAAMSGAQSVRGA